MNDCCIRLRERIAYLALDRKHNLIGLLRRHNRLIAMKVQPRTC